jgi:protein TonB
MSKSFLTGNFLPGRESIFRHVESGRATEGVGSSRLAEAIDERETSLYDRRQKYRVGVQGSLAGAICIMLVAVNIDYRPDAEFVIDLAEQEVAVIEEIQQTEHIERPPPPPRPPVPVEVPNDELLDEEVLALDAEIDFDEPLDVPPPPPPGPKEEEEPEIFVVVEEMPELIGGVVSLQQAVEYPEVARLAGIEGVVVVQIVINEDGTPSDPRILRSAGDILNDAAVKALLQQRFKPGRQRGKPVRVQMAFPVTFRLS